MNKQEILRAVENSQDIQTILQIMRDLHLHDAWLCAGLIRNFIWNLLSGQTAFDYQTDIDIIFFDPSITKEATADLWNKQHYLV